MKITDVIIKEFLTIGEAQLSLADLGLVHISGSSDETAADSNGSGKSSLGDAISWCLWGTTARGVTADEVVNTGAGADTQVTVIIDDSGDRYRIDRYRKHKKFKNAVHLNKLEDDGTETNLTKGTATLTQKQIERVLGCSEEVFNAAVYSGQEMMPDIPRMTDKQLKLLVEQAAGVDVLANAYDLAREQLRKASQTRAETQVNYDRTIEREADLLAQIERTDGLSDQWEVSQAVKIKNLEAETKAAVAEFNTEKDKLDPTEMDAVKKSIVETQKSIEDVAGEKTREADLLQTQSEAQRAVTQLDTRLTLAQSAMGKAQAAIPLVVSRIGKPCGECGKAYHEDDMADAKELAEDAAARAEEELGSVAAKNLAAQKMLASATKDLEDFRATMTDISAAAAALQNLNRELQILEAGIREVEHLRSVAKRKALEWSTAAKEDNPYKSLGVQQEADLAKMKTVVLAALKAAKTANIEEQYSQAVADIYSPGGVRAHRLDEATPYLNDRTAHYLGSLADGAIEAYWTTLTESKSGKGALQEKFSVSVEKAGSASSFNGLSGGEKRKVRLACALALQDLVASRATKNLEIMILDEIDDALDPAGLERLMGILEAKAQERGSILLISHNDLGSYVRNEWQVVKVNNRSTVRTS